MAEEDPAQQGTPAENSVMQQESNEPIPGQGDSKPAADDSATSIGPQVAPATLELFRKYAAAACKITPSFVKGGSGKTPAPECPQISDELCALRDVKCATGSGTSTQFVDASGAVIATGNNKNGMVFYRGAGTGRRL